MDLTGLIGMILGHQTEDEKADLYQKQAQANAQAQQQTNLYDANTVTPARINATNQTLLGLSNSMAPSYGGGTTGVQAMSMLNPDGSSRSPYDLSNLYQTAANANSGTYGARAGADTAIANRTTDEQPSQEFADTNINMEQGMKGELGQGQVQNAIGQLPVTNQIQNTDNQANLNTAKVAQGTTGNSLSNLPLTNATTTQGDINAYAGSLNQPTARPGMTVHYGETPGGAITRSYGSSPMSMQDTMTQMMLGNSGLAGSGTNGMVSLGGGKSIPSIIGQVPGMQSDNTPAIGTPMLDAINRMSQTPSSTQQNTKQGYKPSFGTLGSSVGGSDVDTTPTSTTPPVSGIQALQQLGLTLDQNGQLQRVNVSSYGMSPSMGQSRITPEQLRQAQVIADLIRRGKMSAQ